MTWHALHAGDPRLLDLAQEYKLHPLHIEDCQHGGQSAKYEEADHYIFIVLKPLAVNAEGTVDIGDLDIFLSKDYLITYEETMCDSVTKVIDKFRAMNSLLPDHAFYKLMDALVDSYIPILEHYSEQIDGIEDRVLTDPDPALLQRIFVIKRALIDTRRVLGQTRDVAGHLVRSEDGWIQPKLHPYFRDIYDHLSRHLETVEMLRDLLSGSLDIYLSSVANRTNQAMKVLALLSTIALPTLVVSGFFGMNFEELPGLKSPHGVRTAIALSGGGTVFLVAILRWMKWI